MVVVSLLHSTYKFRVCACALRVICTQFDSCAKRAHFQMCSTFFLSSYSTVRYCNYCFFFFTIHRDSLTYNVRNYSVPFDWRIVDIVVESVDLR